MGSVANGRLPSAADPGFGFPHGHQGNLTEAEAKSLQDFKKLLEEKGEYSPGPPATCEDHKLLYVWPPTSLGAFPFRTVAGLGKC